MAIAIMILSNEGGRDAVTTIAPSKEAAREVVGIAKRATGTKFLSVSSMAAPIMLSEAYKVMGEQWEQGYRGQGNGARQGEGAENPQGVQPHSCEDKKP
jgi:hypothetical protein